MSRFAALYFALTVALTWPLALHLGDRVPNDPGDSLLNVFLLAWNAREVPLTERWWNLPQFYPARGAMAFSEHLVGLSVLATPVIVASGNALLGYNVVFLLSFPLCALAAHALAFQLTRRHDLSLVAGIAFGFAPYRMSQLAHVQVLSSYWMPLALLGLHRFAEDRRRRWLALFTGAWMLQALACGYYLFYLSVLVGVWLLWFAAGRLPWRDIARIGAAWLAGVALVAPFGIGYLRYLGLYGFVRGQEEIESFSADLASVLSASGNLSVWGWLNVFGRAEGDLFPGLTLTALIAGGVLACWRAESPGTRLPRVLGAAAALFALVAVITMWTGPWRLEIGGARLVSASAAGKPLAFALLLGIVAALRHPAGRAAWRRRSPLAFYAGAAGLMWLMALGPAPTAMGRPLFDVHAAPYYAPYAWLMTLPGVDGVRVPARFWMLASLCLAVAGALATGHLTRRMRRAAPLFPAAVAALIALEGWPEGVRLVVPPDRRPASGAAVARLEIPMGPGYDVAALYRATDHRLPVFNGYSGFFPPHHGVLMGLLASRDPDVLERLASVGPIEVVVDHTSDPAGEWRRFVSGHAGAEVAASAADHTVYRLPSAAPGRTVTVADRLRLPVVRLDASIHPDDVGFVLDGDLDTRWHTGPQAPGHQLLVDLGQRRRVDVFELQLGGHTADFPRELVLEVSSDGDAWSTVWAGRTATHALWAAIEGPRTLPLRFPLHGREARAIRLRQVGEDPVYYWSIAELAVYGE